MSQSTRIRRHDGIPHIEVKIRGAWEVLAGIDTHGDMNAIKEWLSMTVPKHVEEIVAEFEAQDVQVKEDAA